MSGLEEIKGDFQEYKTTIFRKKDYPLAIYLGDELLPKAIDYHKTSADEKERQELADMLTKIFRAELVLIKLESLDFPPRRP